MTIRVPDYFLKFKCIADKCTDSCCVGWEIDIDDVTRTKYASLNRDIGEEIRRKTRHGCFPLDANGRCVFLDDGGLCRIISDVGEGYLCDICREHPRYYGIGKSGIDGGLGLACPEAARIILSLDRRPEYTEIEAAPHYSSEDGYAGIAEDVRELIFEVIYGGDEIISALTDMADYADELCFCLLAGIEIPKYESKDPKTINAEELYERVFSVFDGCESLSPEWNKRMKASSECQTLPKKDSTTFRNLLFYFTHRYVRECIEDMTMGQRILLALYSSLLIIALADTYECNGYEQAAVLFSKNIEYSTDNIDNIIDRISEYM